MEPQKDQFAENLSTANSTGQSAQEPVAANVPVMQEPPAPTAPVSAPTAPPSLAPEPALQSPAPTPVPGPADHTVEQLPAPEAYGAIIPLVSPIGAGPIPAKSGATKKKLLVAAGVGVVTLLIAGGAVFGLYLPNTQGNVWNTGLNRSGKALDSLVQSATTADRLKTYETSVIKGTLEANADGAKYSGTLNTTFDKKSLDAVLDVHVSEGILSEALSAKVISQIADGKMYPDLYLQLTGLKTLGLDAFLPDISTYDGKWIKIDSSYLQSIGNAYGASGDNTSSEVSSSDVAEIARAASGVTKDYLFSTARDKAVLVKKSFVGKEQADGLSTYHYKVGVNTDHLQAYCVAITNAVLSTNGYKKASGLSSTEITNLKKDATTSCKSAGSDIKSTDTFDMWIDAHYKLVYKIRFYDTGSTSTYVDVGQLYKGGNKLSLFLTYHDASIGADGKLTVDTDLQSSDTKATLTLKETGGDTPYDLTATLDATASNKPVQVTLPTNATPLEDVLKKTGLDGVLPVAGESNPLGGSADTSVFRAL